MRHSKRSGDKNNNIFYTTTVNYVEKKAEVVRTTSNCYDSTKATVSGTRIMRRKGFTIPELIIVISVIAILAAIALVSYNGVTNRGNDAAVQADLEAVAGLLESYKADPDTPDEFPHDTTALATLGIKATKNSYDTTLSRNFIYCASANYQTYKLAGASKSGKVFMMTEDGFATHSLTKNDLTASFCTNQGMAFTAAGMSAPNTWQPWVGS